MSPSDAYKSLHKAEKHPGLYYADESPGESFFEHADFLGPRDQREIIREREAKERAKQQMEGMYGPDVKEGDPVSMSRGGTSKGVQGYATKHGTVGRKFIGSEEFVVDTGNLTREQFSEVIPQEEINHILAVARNNPRWRDRVSQIDDGLSKVGDPRVGDEQDQFSGLVSSAAASIAYDFVRSGAYEEGLNKELKAQGPQLSGDIKQDTTALQNMRYNEIREELMEGGMTEEEAGRRALELIEGYKPIDPSDLVKNIKQTEFDDLVDSWINSYYKNEYDSADSLDAQREIRERVARQIVEYQQHTETEKGVPIVEPGSDAQGALYVDQSDYIEDPLYAPVRIDAVEKPMTYGEAKEAFIKERGDAAKAIETSATASIRMLKTGDLSSRSSAFSNPDDIDAFEEFMDEMKMDQALSQWIRIPLTDPDDSSESPITAEDLSGAVVGEDGDRADGVDYRKKNSLLIAALNDFRKSVNDDANNPTRQQIDEYYQDKLDESRKSIYTLFRNDNYTKIYQLRGGVDFNASSVVVTALPPVDEYLEQAGVSNRVEFDYEMFEGQPQIVLNRADGQLRQKLEVLGVDTPFLWDGQPVMIEPYHIGEIFRNMNIGDSEEDGGDVTDSEKMKFQELVGNISLHLQDKLRGIDKTTANEVAHTFALAIR